MNKSYLLLIFAWSSQNYAADQASFWKNSSDQKSAEERIKELSDTIFSLRKHLVSVARKNQKNCKKIKSDIESFKQIRASYAAACKGTKE